MANELDELRRRLDRLEAREACVSTFNEYLHYILTDPDSNPAVKMRMEDIVQERNPTNPFPEPQG